MQVAADDKFRRVDQREFGIGKHEAATAAAKVDVVGRGLGESALQVHATRTQVHAHATVDAAADIDGVGRAGAGGTQHDQAVPCIHAGTVADDQAGRRIALPAQLDATAIGGDADALANTQADGPRRRPPPAQVYVTAVGGQFAAGHVQADRRTDAGDADVAGRGGHAGLPGEIDAGSKCRIAEQANVARTCNQLRIGEVDADAAPRRLALHVDVAARAVDVAAIQRNASRRAGTGDRHCAAATRDLVALHQHACSDAGAFDGDRAAAAADRERAAIAQLHAHATGAGACHADVAAVGDQAIAGYPHASRGGGRSCRSFEGDIAAVGVQRAIGDVQAEVRTGAVQADRAGGRRNGAAIAELDADAGRRSTADDHVAGAAGQLGVVQVHACAASSGCGAIDADVAVCAVDVAADQ